MENISDASGDEDDNEDSDDEKWTIRGLVDLMSGAPPHTIPSEAARVLGIARAKKIPPGKTLGTGMGKTWRAVKA